MKSVKITYPKENEHYNNQILNIDDAGLNIQFGTVFLKKGIRIPLKGFARHPYHEISVIQQGKIEMLNEDGSRRGYLHSGDVVYFAALEAQAGNVLEDTKISYTLIKK